MTGSPVLLSLLGRYIQLLRWNLVILKYVIVELPHIQSVVTSLKIVKTPPLRIFLNPTVKNMVFFSLGLVYKTLDTFF